MPGSHVPAHCIEQGLRAIEVRKALGQVERASLHGELGHGGEDGRADIRQFAADHGALFPGVYPARGGVRA
ncbi:hypothetical protein D9M71_792690 [compost metagenome]